MSRKTVRIAPVEFARKGSPAQAEGEVVRRRGVIFRAGDYSHQQFSMSPDELRALAASFTGPIPLDHGHPTTDGPIDFGALESVDVSPDGTTLYGTTATPAWLNQALDDAKWLVSASFDRATKAIRRLSLVTRPQISDAKLHAAFCACHPESAWAEATFTTPKEEPPMPTKKEQAIARLQEMDDADEDVFDAILADPDDGDSGDEPKPLVVVAPGPTPTEQAAFARIAELEEKDRAREAASFAAGEVRANRISPFEEANAAAVMAQALRDDAELSTTVNFSQSGKTVAGTREQMVRAAYAQRQPRAWDKEQIANFAGVRVLPNGGGGEETDEEYARRVCVKHNGKNRIAGAAS